MSKSKGEWITCWNCGGYGVVSGYTFGGTDFTGAKECAKCSSGGMWRYPSGVLARYPGGPLCGRDADPEPVVAK